MLSSITSTGALIAKALAAGVAPDKIVKPSNWTQDHLIVADGPRAGSKWDPEQTPYFAEILDLLAPDDPSTLVVVKKSAQVGFSQLGVGWAGYIIDVTPAQAMVVSATINSVQEFNREKLQPSIDATPALRIKVRENKSRSSAGSTKMSKRFPGGSLSLTGANSTADLRGGTKKYIFCDEVDEWDDNLNGQGDPMEMVDARQISFHATGEYKKLVGSTPTIKKSSRVDHLFEAGDQRYWNVPCPHCDEFQRLVFKRLQFDKVYPHSARYACEHCGALIDHHHKKEMVRKGKWVATKPGPGRHPSFHVDTLISLLTTWDKIAEKWIAAGSDHNKLKAFFNLWLGEAWEERGDAPELSRMMSRRDDYRLGQVPAGGLIITGAADVQKTGIYYEVVAWGRTEESWSIDFGFLPGDTSDEEAECWRMLDKLRARTYRNAYGRYLGIDLFGIDCKYNSGQVYAWVRRQGTDTYAVRGTFGWGAMPIGTPVSMEIDYKGKKRRRGLQIWPIGSYSLKSKLFANLRKEGMKEGREENPTGYCHFSLEHDEQFFQQMTAETLKDKKRADGRVLREWCKTGENHFHDCRIYNMGLIEHPRIALGRMTEEEWAQLASNRDTPPPVKQNDLFVSTPVVAPPVKRGQADQDDTADNYFNNQNTEDWFEP